MPHKIRWEEMFPDQFVAARDHYPLCYMGYGLAEPHGPFNALGLDFLKARALVERAAGEHGGIVAPPFAWHIQELPEFHDDGKGHGWLVDVGVKQSLCSSLPAGLFYAAVLYHIRAMDARGFKAGILVTGHYGGVEIVLRKLCEFYLRRTGSPIRLAALADWECIDPASPYRGDHAGITETSQLMALCPDMVDLQRRRVPAELGTRFAGGVDFQGKTLPSAELGARIVDSQVRRLGEMGRELLAGHTPRPGWVAPTVRDVEDVWQRFEGLTRKYWTGTFAEYMEGGKMFGFPSWESLGE